MTLALSALLGAGSAAAQELRGHGGPVRAIAVGADGALAVTGSFDTSVILWRLGTGAAEAVLRFHDGSVNALVSLPDGRFASGGEDGRVALWRVGNSQPDRVITGHRAPVSGLAVSPDGRLIASSSWDGTARITALSGGDPAVRVLEGHRGQVNGVAFLPDGGVVTSGYDATLRLWPADGAGNGGVPGIVTLPAPLTSVVAAADGEMAVAGADGVLRFVRDGRVTHEIAVGQTPLVALALTRDGTALAAGGIRGQVSIIDRGTKRVRANLVGPGLPVLPAGQQFSAENCCPAGRTGWCAAGTRGRASTSAR
jgi:cytochrome c